MGNNSTFGEIIFQKLLLTDFIKQYLTSIIIAILANLIQLIIVSWLSSLINIHYVVDFVLQIGLSFVISINNIKLYNIVERFSPEIDVYVTQFITNYNIKKYKFWKRAIVGGSIILCAFYIYQFPITNDRIYLLLLQSACTFILLELWDDYYLQEWFKKMCTKNPTINIISTEEYNKYMIDSYIGSKMETVSNSDSIRKININATDLSMGFIDK